MLKLPEHERTKLITTNGSDCFYQTEEASALYRHRYSSGRTSRHEGVLWGSPKLWARQKIRHLTMRLSFQSPCHCQVSRQSHMRFLILYK